MILLLILDPEMKLEFQLVLIFLSSQVREDLS